MKEKESSSKKRVAIYTRVSSDEQKKEGLSLDAQKRKLEEYALSKGWWVYKIYTDAGISGSSIKKRKAFKEMLKDAGDEKFSAILITKLDRAFRNVVDAILTVQDLCEKNIDFISISEQIDTTSAMGKFFFVLMSALAQLERDLTSDRVSDILMYKFKKGLLVGKSPLGYKYKKSKKKFIIDPKNGEKIQDIFLMASQGKNYKEICKKHKIGITTYYKILRNKAYIGIVEFKGKEKVGTHESLIDQDTFEKVNKQLGANR